MMLVSKSIKLLFLWIIILILPTGGFTYSFKGISIAQQNDLIQGYWGSLTSFKKKLCAPEDKEAFDRFFKEYKGSGYYIPIHNQNLVKEAIVESMPLLNKKIQWTKDLQKKLSKLNSLPVFNAEVNELNLLIDENTKLRYQSDTGTLSETKNSALAKEQVINFKKKFKVFIEKIFYLKNIDYPVDHYANRSNYDRLMAQALPTTAPNVVPALVIARQSLYLKRKFYEDGAMDPDLTRTDISLRTLIDTFTLGLKDINEYFTPEIIRDWEWIARNAQNMQTRGIAIQKSRFESWQSRLVAMKEFYDNLLRQNNKSSSIFLTELSVASDNLKNFVEAKLAKVYEFWVKQPEALRNLFVLETILMHEVGTVDPSGDDRKKVVEVVLNRVHDSDYHFLRAADPWEKLLGYSLRDQKYWWLNVLYRKGEFSFMHFFMLSSYKVFCPEDTPAVKNLRESNLKLSLEVLRNYEPQGVDTNIFRYFSRISMLGRIDMTSVWSPPYELVDEAPGTRVEPAEEKKVINQWKSGKWRYLYSFKNGLNLYRVFEIDGKAWTMHWENSVPNQVYSYRDRDYFKFFRLP